jgi:hypothetical protein
MPVGREDHDLGNLHMQRLLEREHNYASDVRTNLLR